MRSLLRLTLLVLGIFLSDARGYAGEPTVVYFVPFEIQTYVPITRADIVSRAWEKWTISDEAADRLFQLFTREDGKVDFDEGNVRAQVVLRGERYFVDTNGIAVKDGMRLRVDRAGFIKFRDSLSPDHRQVLRRK